jgi:cell wall-associated NlpC family hydrolase
VSPDKVSQRTTVDVKKVLYEIHDDWEGTSYQYGGLSKRGIDCSGFVYITFRSGFGVMLPRTTAHQARLGKPISKSHLMAGDLVFFKTGAKVLHVGVYVEKGLFLHASTSRGVMLSQLDNPHWRANYWMAKRI